MVHHIFSALIFQIYYSHPQMRDFVAGKSAELEAAHVAAVAAEKAKLAADSDEALQREREALRTQLTEELTDKLRSTLQELFGRVGEETEARLKELEAMRARLAAVDALLATRAVYDHDAAAAHRTTLASLALIDALGKPVPASHEVAALLVAAEGRDPVVTWALASLPSQSVHAAKGVPTLHGLQTRFAAVQKAARRAALTPESSGILGQAVGAATSMLVIPPRQQQQQGAAGEKKREEGGGGASAALSSARAFLTNALSSAGGSGSAVGAAVQTPLLAVDAAAESAATAVAAGETAVEKVCMGRSCIFTRSSVLMENFFANLLRAWGRRGQLYFSIHFFGESSHAGKNMAICPPFPPHPHPYPLLLPPSPYPQALKGAQVKAKELAATASEVSADVRRVSGLFDTAQAAVDAGDLRHALALLEPLSGYAGEAVRDWMVDARHRLACDDAAAVLRARAVVLAASLY